MKVSVIGSGGWGHGAGAGAAGEWQRRDPVVLQRGRIRRFA